MMKDEYLIRPLRGDEALEAKRLIYTVAQELMEPEMSMEEVTTLWDGWGAFCDLDDVQKNYFENGGVFLVTVYGGRIVGTGAFHRYAKGVCELRRITLLPEYRGQGLGYAMMMELLRWARSMGYGKVCLWTHRIKLAHAVDFYHRLGFVDVPHEGADAEELWMEMKINSISINADE